MKVRSQSGMTLIEIVVAIVVISMAAGTIVGLLAFMARGSAEEMARVQSTSIANAYLQQVLSRSFDEVDNYDGHVDDGAVDALGNAITGFERYSVAIDVRPAALVDLPSADAQLVTVTVTDPMGDRVVLSGFKARHP